MKKIICLLGSAREEGYSSSIAKHFIKTAKEYGTEEKIYNLYHMNFKGCQGCWTCHRSTDICIIQDELTPVLDEVKEADLLILTSPIYFGDISAATKAFIERTHSFIGPVDKDENLRNDLDNYKGRVSPGKQVVFIMSQGDEEENNADLYPKNSKFFKWYGYDETHVIRALRVEDPGYLGKRHNKYLLQAEELARKIMEAQRS